MGRHPDDPVVASNVPGYSGSGFVDFLRPSGGFVSWDLSAAELPEDREYLVRIRYANGGSAARTMRLEQRSASTGGGVAHEYDVTFEPTGAWTDWRTKTVRVRLNAVGFDPTRLGQVISLKAVGESGPNVDWIKII